MRCRLIFLPPLIHADIYAGLSPLLFAILAFRLPLPLRLFIYLRLYCHADDADAILFIYATPFSPLFTFMPLRHLRRFSLRHAFVSRFTVYADIHAIDYYLFADADYAAMFIAAPMLMPPFRHFLIALFSLIA